MNSDYKIRYSDTGQLVFFEVDMQELFGINISTPGVISALNKAFNVSKTAVPIKTGLMLRSYTMDKISDTTVRCYFDPKKIIGKKRLNRIVKEYYPQYLVQYPSRLNWLDIVIKRFYDALKIEMKALSKTNKQINMDSFYPFLLLLMAAMEMKIQQEKKIRKQQEERKKALEEKRQKFLKSIKEGGK